MADSDTFDSEKLKNLKTLFEKRVGGQINIRGIYFQILYSMERVLSELNRDRTAYACLEGIDDLDIYKCETHKDERFVELSQVKTSDNKYNASDFTSVLTGFEEAYVLNPNARFVFAFNMSFSSGFLKKLYEANSKNNEIPRDVSKHWHKKLSFDDLESTTKFLKQINFYKIDERFLLNSIKRSMVSIFSIESQGLSIYLQALFLLFFESAKNRTEIRIGNLISLVDSIKNDISRSTKSLAMSNGWVSKLNFSPSTKSEENAYYEGKSAKPWHVFSQIPIVRARWITEVKSNLENFDCAIVKSSSGQGKSTVALQVALQCESQDWLVFQLLECSQNEQLEHITKFFEDKLIFGVPILVLVDGLSDRNSLWGEIAHVFRNKPVKFIVTSREEDWARFPPSFSSIRIGVVDIHLSSEEAGEIFTLLKNKNKLHIKTPPDWQSSWEKVSSSKLLIEYIFLLTQGQMLEERLREQKKVIQSENHGDFKSEVIKLVAISHCCGIKLSISTLFSHFNKKDVSIERIERVLEELQNEFLLEVVGREGRQSLEGLHLVRSQHIYSIFCKYPIFTIKKLISLIDKESLTKLFYNLPVLLDEISAKELLRQVAEEIDKLSVPELSYILRGLFNYDAHQHWILNKDIYDRIYNMYGSGISLFALQRSQWVESKPFESLSILSSDSEEKIRLASEIQNLPFTDMYTHAFLFELKRNVEGLSHISEKSLDNVGELLQWFSVFKIKVLLKNIAGEENFYSYFRANPIEKSKLVFSTVFSNDSHMYNKLIQELDKEIEYKFIKDTNSLRLERSDNQVTIYYLVDNEQTDESYSLNQSSMEKINLLKAIYPFFDSYQSRGVYTPLPYTELYTQRVDDSLKNISSDTLFDEFRVTLNSQWISKITSFYEHPTIFEWQKQIFQLRERALYVVRHSLIYFESQIGIIHNHKLFLDRLKQGLKDLFVIQNNSKKFPEKQIEEERSEEVENAIKEVNDWSSSVKNYSHLIVDVDREDYYHLLHVNIFYAFEQLEKMQEAFRYVLENTYFYMPVDKLETLCEEEKSYYRLLKNTLFFLKKRAQQDLGVYVKASSQPRQIVKKWRKNRESFVLKEIRKNLLNIESLLGIEFVYPTKIYEKDCYEKVNIGVKRDWASFVNSELERQILYSLCLCSDIDVMLLSIFFVIDESFLNGGGYNLNTSWLKDVKKAAEEGDVQGIKSLDSPLAVPIKDEFLEQIMSDHNKLTLLEQSSDFADVIRMFELLWVLAEYKKASKEVENNQVSKYLQQKALTVQKEIQDKIQNVPDGANGLKFKFEQLYKDLSSNTVANIKELFGQFYIDSVEPNMATFIPSCLTKK